MLVLGGWGVGVAVVGSSAAAAQDIEREGGMRSFHER